MKKKIIAIVMAAVLALCVFAGCSNGGGSDTGSGANTDYMSWTATEWNAASDEEKEAATTALMKYMIEDNGISMTDEILSSAIEPQLDTMMSSLDTAFAASDTITLKDIAEASSSVMGDMLQ